MPDSNWRSLRPERSGLTGLSQSPRVDLSDIRQVAYADSDAWCPERESNPRPSRYKGAALATELPGH